MNLFHVVLLQVVVSSCAVKIIFPCFSSAINVGQAG